MVRIDTSTKLGPVSPKAGSGYGKGLTLSRELGSEQSMSVTSTEQ